ncbi:lipase member H-like [Conger conger]|uniref:lipase member H-like n=1 Tax=Conger conger TaxID=82655 RepID=UPI002A59C028|nr:lipase member H-like [Conger conger]
MFHTSSSATNFRMLVWWFLGMVGAVTISKGLARECDDFTRLHFHNSFIGTSLRVRFLLYTRANESCGLELSHHNVSETALFNLTRRTAFVIHGYRLTGSPPIWLDEIVKKLLAQEDMNVLVFDWNYGAANLNYLIAVRNMRKAADNATAFIQQMQENGASLSSIHMIGVSLGAHLAGFVGKKFKNSKIHGKIGRITALDPAGPEFTNNPPEDRLDVTDAQFVDVVHTDMDALGFRAPLGHIDFYANGGADQPGCPKTIFSGKQYFICDHQRAVYLFLCSLDKDCNITAYPCSSYDDFLDGKCTQCDTFKPAPCPILGYYVTEWKDTLLQLNQTKAFFSTTDKNPYFKTYYQVDIVPWNKPIRWGVLTIKLHNGTDVAEAKINHKSTKFEQYKSTRMLAQFDKNLQTIRKISLQFSTGNVAGPSYKLRLLRFQLRSLEHFDRPVLCRYDIILEDNVDVSFRPIPCETSDF